VTEAGVSFLDLTQRAAGFPPYPYQERIAHEGLPELLKVPTGAGKTLAAVLPWLHRRRFHPELAVRASTPHWLVFVLPMRVLVEQTYDVVRGWLRAAGLEETVGLYSVMGGEGRRTGRWREIPEQDAIFIGTLDMLLSRALNRGYGEGRFTWPIDFGMFNARCQWVFDDVQLMGPALPTSRQLDGLRRVLGTAAPCHSMWMSATVDEPSLSTIDLPSIRSVVEIGPEDRAGSLAARLDATKEVREVSLETKRYEASLADALNKVHRPGTRTIAVLNTVERARRVYKRLAKAGAADVVLLHSRFRPPDRAEQTIAALADVDPEGPGRIIVATQVLEAGVDITATTLFTEAAPWPSIVQRAGRCNRDGEATDALLLWTRPLQAPPYEGEDIEASAAALHELEGTPVNPSSLAGLSVPVREVVHPALRRRDLIGLFDTTPDLSGNDLDVGRFIREADDLDVQVAWRPVDESGPAATDPSPTRDELCPVPIASLRKELQKEDWRAWRFDHLESRWVRCWAGDLRPGQILVLRSAEGGYVSLLGWDPLSRSAVDPVEPEEGAAFGGEEGTAEDRPTFGSSRWVALLEHLADVEEEVRSLVAALDPVGLTPGLVESAAAAGRLHDLGKAHEIFQGTLRKSAEESGQELPVSGGPWAKSPGLPRARHERRHFRHELVSALALVDDRAAILGGIPEPDLVTYLVAAHHGRVRLAIRSLPNEDIPSNDGDRRVAMGVWDGDVLPATEVPGGHVPETTVDLSVMEMGDGDDGQPSWTRRALALRDRPDLGPFRLAFLEALVRLADWRVSARG
jgi:CRISPR-associated endonuclease/helicase Cas3